MEDDEAPGSTQPARRDRARRRHHNRRPSVVEIKALSTYSPNPRVRLAALRFEEGERMHSLGRCACCLELRVVFFATPPIERDGYDGSPPASNVPWKLHPDREAGGDARICARCKADRDSRRRNGLLGTKPAKFSGWRSKTWDMGPADDDENPIRHNDMHFLPVPIFLRNLRPMERALVSKIICIQKIEMLKGGMLRTKPQVTPFLHPHSYRPPSADSALPPFAHRYILLNPLLPTNSYLTVTECAARRR